MICVRQFLNFDNGFAFKSYRRQLSLTHDATSSMRILWTPFIHSCLAHYPQHWTPASASAADSYGVAGQGTMNVSPVPFLEGSEPRIAPGEQIPDLDGHAIG